MVLEGRPVNLFLGSDEKIYPDYGEGSLVTSSYIPASYVVYKDGSTYYARGTRAGLGTYSGTTAVTVINNAIADMSDGEKMFFKKGTYIITDTIDIVNNITLEGEHAMGSVLIASGTFSPMIDIDEASTYVYIKNLMIDGDQNCAILIDASITSSTDLPFFIIDCLINGATSKSLVVDNRGAIHIIRCKFGLSTSTSPYCIYADYGSTAREIRITDSIITWATTACIYCDDQLHLRIVNSILGCADGAIHVQLENGARLTVVTTWFENWKAHAVYNSGGSSWGYIYAASTRFGGKITGRYGSISFNGCSIITDIPSTYSYYIDVEIIKSMYGDIRYMTSGYNAINIQSGTTGGVHLFDHYNGQYQSNIEEFGVGTISSGNYSVTIYHNLGDSTTLGYPDLVLLTGRHDETCNIIVTTKYTDRFDVHTLLDATVSADRNFDWYARWTP